MSDYQLTRRHLLRGLTMALAVFVASPLSQVLSAPTEDAAEPETHEETSGEIISGILTIGGTIERIELPQTLYLRTEEMLLQVGFLAGTSFWHGNLEQVPDLTPFLPGDEVMVTGHWNSEGIFEATSLGSLCRIIRGQVLSERGNHLETPEGVVYRTDRTIGLDRAEFARLGKVTRKTLPEKLAGTEIVVEAWRDPATNQFLARQIGV